MTIPILFLMFSALAADFNLVAGSIRYRNRFRKFRVFVLHIKLKLWSKYTLRLAQTPDLRPKRAVFRVIPKSLNSYSSSRKLDIDLKLEGNSSKLCSKSLPMSLMMLKPRIKVPNFSPDLKLPMSEIQVRYKWDTSEIHCFFKFVHNFDQL